MARQISFDGIDYVRPTLFNGPALDFNGTPSFRLNPIMDGIRQETELKGGGGLGAVLGAVVAIAVPFVAPFVAESLFATSAMSAFAATATTAATGAVLGGLGAAATGGDWRMGALTGGIGSGAMQYFNPTAGQGGVGGLWDKMTGQPAVSLNGSSSGVSSPVPQGEFYANNPVAPVDPTTGQAIMPGAEVGAGNVSTLTSGGSASSNLGNTLSAGPSDFSMASTAGGDPTGYLDMNGKYVQFGGAGGPSSVDYSLTGGTQPGLRMPGSYTGPTLSANAPGSSSFLGMNVSPQMASRLTDASIIAGTNLAGSVIAQQMAGKQYEQQMQKYNAELEALKGKDEAAYQQKMTEVQAFIQNAKNINPEYFAQQSANQARITGQRNLAEAWRSQPMAGLKDAGFATGEKRRAELGLSQNVGSAYDRGFQFGTQTRNQQLQTGLNMMPNAPSRYLSGISNENTMLNNMNANIGSAAKGYSEMMSPFSYAFLSDTGYDRMMGKRS